MKIVTDCEAASDYFKHRRSAAGIMGFSGYQKISAAMRVIAYGIPADYTDEYLRIGQDTTTEFVRRFAKLVIKLYGEKYLRAPNEEDTKRLMEMNKKRGCRGCLVVLITCIGGEKIAQRHGTACIAVKAVMLPLCLRP